MVRLFYDTKDLTSKQNAVFAQALPQIISVGHEIQRDLALGEGSSFKVQAPEPVKKADRAQLPTLVQMGVHLCHVLARIASERIGSLPNLHEHPLTQQIAEAVSKVRSPEQVAAGTSEAG